MSEITGYHQLSEEEEALINEIKQKAVECGELVDKLRNLESFSQVEPMPKTADLRWVSIGATDLQTGFMALVRSVAKPETF